MREIRKKLKVTKTEGDQMNQVLDLGSETLTSFDSPMSQNNGEIFDLQFSSYQQAKPHELIENSVSGLNPLN